MIFALFAVDELGGMGYNNALPWPRNREDMQLFKATTQDQIVVMGKKTWDSADMPVPLPNRTNVLVTNNFIARSDILQLKGDICTGLISLSNEFSDLDIFVIGGPGILMQAKPVIERVLLTRIPGEYQCDVSIDLVEFLKNFELIKTITLTTCKIEQYASISPST